MNEPREIQSSIRYSQKVADIVNKAQGKTFADRFENIVLNYPEQIDYYERELKAIQKQILESRKTLQKITDNIRSAKNVELNIEAVRKYADLISSECNTN